jgi:hypothetical protein
MSHRQEHNNHVGMQMLSKQRLRALLFVVACLLLGALHRNRNVEQASLAFSSSNTSTKVLLRLKHGIYAHDAMRTQQPGMQQAQPRTSQQLPNDLLRLHAGQQLQQHVCSGLETDYGGRSQNASERPKLMIIIAETEDRRGRAGEQGLQQALRLVANIAFSSSHCSTLAAS